MQSRITIERAETFDEETINSISTDFYLDIFFLKFEFKSLLFKRDDKFYQYKELLPKLTLIEQSELIVELKGSLYFFLNPHSVLSKCGFKLEDFYKDDNNNIVFSDNIAFINNDSQLYKKLGITFVHYEIVATPLRVTYPVNEQIFVFTVENKKFKV